MNNLSLALKFAEANMDYQNICIYIH